MENLDKLVNELRKLPTETQWLEFKHNNYTPDMIGKDISALANSALWPGAWSERPHILKWSAAVVGQATWHLQEENLKFAGAEFGSGFFAWRLWLSGYMFAHGGSR